MKLATAPASAYRSARSERVRGSMQPQEYAILQELIRELRPQRTLEVGMANGESSNVFCQWARDRGGEPHVAIDPFQSAPDGWNGEGLKLLERQGLRPFLELIEDFDYCALPRLVESGRRFDCILIDGWHSFDYTLIDLFYADLLLEPQGVVAVHDTGWAAVHKALMFLETHKPYERLSPPPTVHYRSLLPKVLRRIRNALAGREGRQQVKARREKWLTLAAYRKREEHQVPDNFFHAF